MASNDVFTQAGSVGWLIDRTAGEHGSILGSAWLFSKDTAITCAHLMVPYADMPEAVTFYLPAFQRSFGVTATKFHPDFDRWMVRRAYEESSIYPPPRLSLQPNNVVGLYLSLRLKPVQRDMVEKKLQTFSGMQEASVFSGTSSGTELMSIIQTIVNSRQGGTIIICDSRRRILARVYCEAGSIKHAQYGELRNETAIHHLIVSPPDGKFFFKVEAKPAWTEEFAPINKPTPALLMEVYRRLDDQIRILGEFGGEFTTFIRVPDAELNLGVLPEEVRKEASLLWPKLKYETPVGRFVHNSKVNGAAIMRALEALAISGQVISASAVPLAMEGTRAPLAVEPFSPVSFKDELYSIHIDPASQMAVVSTGTILGSRKQDPAPQMHTIGIPPEVLGAPIFKAGMVVGMHCGNIAGIEEDNQFQEVNQLLWSESVYTCLDLAPPAPKSAASAQIGDTAGGAHDQEASASAAAKASALETSGSPARKPPRTTLLNSITFALPFMRKTGFDVELQRQEIGSERWSRMGSNGRLRIGDGLSVIVRVLQEEISLCVFYTRGENLPARMLYPEPDGGKLRCELLPRGTQLILPERSSQGSATSGEQLRASAKTKLAGIRIHDISGQESLVFISSSNELTVSSDQPSLDMILANAIKLSSAQQDLKPIEVVEKQLFGSQAFSPGNVLSLSRLALNCC